MNATILEKKDYKRFYKKLGAKFPRQDDSIAILRRDENYYVMFIRSYVKLPIEKEFAQIFLNDEYIDSRFLLKLE